MASPVDAQVKALLGEATKMSSRISSFVAEIPALRRSDLEPKAAEIGFYHREFSLIVRRVDTA